MTMEYIELGSSPYEENCVQVGEANYHEKMRKELAAYVNQLNRMFNQFDNHAIMFKSKWFNHDFGSYGEVCVYWNTSDEEADTYVYEIERSLPAYWDEEAKKELGLENGN